MLRKNLLAVCLCLAAVVAMSTLASGSEGRRAPNLIIIHCDELHYGVLGCYGGRIVKTPNIDWLAQNGAICTSFYATTPVCSPSRASFVSGKYPQNTNVTTNNIPMADEIVTFAAVLSEHGYATGYAGKWHLDGPAKPGWTPARKFGFQENLYMFNRGHWKILEDTPDGPRVGARDKRNRPSYSVAGANEKNFTTDFLTAKAIDFITRHADEPFCFMVSIPDPHGPNTVRPPYDTMYLNVNVPIPRTLHKEPHQIPAWGKPQPEVTETALRRIMPPYYGMVKCIDDNVGKILNTLRQKKLLDNTIVVFTADHGDLCGEHGRLNKGVPYEGSAKIPFIIYFPGKIPAGKVVNEALGTVDFAPTILSLMGFEPPKDVEGRDASCLFLPNGCSEWDDFTVVRSTSQPQVTEKSSVWLAAVTDRYKLVFSTVDEPWLFDLQEDPEELTNRFNDPNYQRVIHELTKKLWQYGERYNDPYIKLSRIQAQMLRILQ